jgi:hypothetical protein
MVQLSATSCSCIAILWISLVSFAAITICVTSQRMFVVVVVVVYFVIDSVWKLLDTTSYIPGTKSIQNHNFTFCFTWVWNLFSHTKGRTQIEVVWELWLCKGFSVLYIKCCNPGTYRYLLILTTSMEQRPSWEYNSNSATQEFPRFLWNPKVHYLVHKSPPLSLSWARWIQYTYSHRISLRFILILYYQLQIYFIIFIYVAVRQNIVLQNYSIPPRCSTVLRFRRIHAPRH